MEAEGGHGGHTALRLVYYCLWSVWLSGSAVLPKARPIGTCSSRDLPWHHSSSAGNFGLILKACCSLKDPPSRHPCHLQVQLPDALLDLPGPIVEHGEYNVSLRIKLGQGAHARLLVNVLPAT